jgi:hypothetical protein
LRRFAPDVNSLERFRKSVAAYDAFTICAQSRFSAFRTVPTLFLLSRLITVSLTQSISNLFNEPDKTINSNRKESQLNRPNGLLANPHPIANPSQKQLRHEHRSVIP